MDLADLKYFSTLIEETFNARVVDHPAMDEHDDVLAAAQRASSALHVLNQLIASK